MTYKVERWGRKMSQNSGFGLRDRWEFSDLDKAKKFVRGSPLNSDDDRFPEIYVYCISDKKGKHYDVLTAKEKREHKRLTKLLSLTNTNPR